MMPTFPIEKGIPMPKGRPDRRGGSQPLRSELRETLRRLDVGDSFEYPLNNKHAYMYARTLGIAVITSKLNGTGWRVWRAA